MTNRLKRIAIQGFSGSFHDTAAKSFYGNELSLVFCSTFSEVVRKSTNSATADGGVMAIENSIAGTILPNYQLLKNSDLSINGEIYLTISQHLMALPGQKISDIKEIHSHHMALKQCDKFLENHPDIKLIETEDTALSAQHIKEGQLKGVAAIASERAAKINKLELIERHIETVKNNFTRFLVINKKASHISEVDKASILFSLPHQPKALATILNTIGHYGFNISKIQSFPIIEREWSYYFVLDIDFDNIEQFQKLLTELQSQTSYFRTLGIYKKGETL